MRSVPTDVELLRHIDKTKSKEFNNDIAYIKSNIEHHNPAKFDQYLEDTLVRSAQHFKTSACGGGVNQMSHNTVWNYNSNQQKESKNDSDSENKNEMAVTLPITDQF